MFTVEILTEDHVGRAPMWHPLIERIHTEHSVSHGKAAQLKRMTKDYDDFYSGFTVPCSDRTRDTLKKEGVYR
jgi:hypothetical protein